MLPIVRKALVGPLLLLVMSITGPIQAQQKPVYGPRRPDALPVSPAARSHDANQGQPVGQGPAPNALAGKQDTGPPIGFQLTKAQSDGINQMLEYWEQQTSKIKTFRTEYGRREFDPVFGPQDNFKTVSTGEIRYAAPDRGMIKEKVVYDYDPAKAKQGVKPPFTRKDDEVGEHWVCDGNSVFEFNHAQKQIVETKLPPEMRGKAIAEGPLPFMFGAKAASIRRRYWIREIPREQKDQPYQLELVPKGRGNAFARVKIYLDPKKFMPDRIDVFDLNGRGHVEYQFKNRRINAVTDNVKNFWDSFVSPKPPRGWTKVRGNVGPPPGPEIGPQQARGPAPQQR